MTAGSLYFSLAYVLRGGRGEENMLKMLISFVVKLATNREENLLLIFLKNVITNVFLTLRRGLQERR